MLKENTIRFRQALLDMIKERRKLMLDPNYSSQDFLTLMLSDSLFKDNETLMVDECASFYVAATQTTATLVANAIYFLTMYPATKSKLSKEIIDNLKAVNGDWDEVLSYDSLTTGNWSYLSQVINETMRMEAPVRTSTLLTVTEPITIKGYSLKKD